MRPALDRRHIISRQPQERLASDRAAGFKNTRIVNCREDQRKRIVKTATVEPEFYSERILPFTAKSSGRYHLANGIARCNADVVNGALLGFLNDARIFGISFRP